MINVLSFQTMCVLQMQKGFISSSNLIIYGIISDSLYIRKTASQAILRCHPLWIDGAVICLCG